ncbi:hypothetical protein H5410_050828 [Solanum commersonii]|uniref:Uncharacterized protein n=1 Tax=Solanum commersonii TaxID=4109 RepID=A0A9J5WWJ2_SOLCO|nr:hypothetical protein H5410_050828 [Solanum commersonii]
MANVAAYLREPEVEVPRFECRPCLNIVGRAQAMTPAPRHLRNNCHGLAFTERHGCKSRSASQEARVEAEDGGYDGLEGPSGRLIMSPRCLEAESLGDPPRP